MASELAIDELVANHDEGIRDRLHIYVSSRDLTRTIMWHVVRYVVEPPGSRLHAEGRRQHVNVGNCR